MLIGSQSTDNTTKSDVDTNAGTSTLLLGCVQCQYTVYCTVLVQQSAAAARIQWSDHFSAVHTRCCHASHPRLLFECSAVNMTVSDLRLYQCYSLVYEFMATTVQLYNKSSASTVT